MSETDRAAASGGARRAAREEVIDAFERAAESYGLSRSHGRLYGVLFFADGPLSLDELADESGYAKSTVSTSLKAMERLQLVHRRSVPSGDRKVYYEAERDVWRIVRAVIQRDVRREIDDMTRVLASAEEQLAAAGGEAAERDRERVRDLRRTYRRGERLVDVLTSTSVDRLKSLLDRLRRE